VYELHAEESLKKVKRLRKARSVSLSPGPFPQMKIFLLKPWHHLHDNKDGNNNHQRNDDYEFGFVPLGVWIVWIFWYFQTFSFLGMFRLLPGLPQPPFRLPLGFAIQLNFVWYFPINCAFAGQIASGNFNSTSGDSCFGARELRKNTTYPVWGTNGWHFSEVKCFL